MKLGGKTMLERKKRSEKKPASETRPRWKTEKVKCPEGEYEARLLLELAADGTGKLKGISCDNPNFAGIDNWDCKWSCWERIKAIKK
jgi:hypothetical protein